MDVAASVTLALTIVLGGASIALSVMSLIGKRRSNARRQETSILIVSSMGATLEELKAVEDTCTGVAADAKRAETLKAQLAAVRNAAEHRYRQLELYGGSHDVARQAAMWFIEQGAPEDAEPLQRALDLGLVPREWRRPLRQKKLNPPVEKK